MSIRKRTLPSGEIRWLVDYRDRKSVRRAKQFKRKAEADAYLVQTGYDLSRGLHIAPGASPTIRDAGASWIARCERDKLVYSTLRQYRQHLRQHIEPAIGEEKLAEITTPRVNEFVNEFLAQHSRSLTRKVLTSLHSIFAAAIATGQAMHNPVHGVKIRKTNAEEHEGDAIEMPTKEELRGILTAAAGRWRPLIVAAMFTGMRSSELRGLKWEDVDFPAGVVRVRRRVDAWGTFGAPKSKAGKRDIPLAPIVLNTLKEHFLACGKGDSNPLGLVFPAPSGRVLAHACILKDGFQPLQVRVGVVGENGRAKFGLHALRHAAAALFIEQGMSPKRVQTILGHASIKMTYDLYGYLFRSEEEDRAAMAQIEARLLS
jgi:integrase